MGDSPVSSRRCRGAVESAKAWSCGDSGESVAKARAIGSSSSAAASKSADDPLELTPYLAVRCGSRWTLSPYGVWGLSDGSPDFGFGLQLSVAVDVPRP